MFQMELFFSGVVEPVFFFFFLCDVNLVIS